MCLLDTTDGALMMALYTSRAFARDRVAVLYYSAVLTAITVAVAAFIGAVQFLSLAQNVLAGDDGDKGPQGPFWDGLSALSDHFEVVGGAVCGLFLVAGLGSAALYGPWRRRAAARAEARRAAAAVLVGGGEGGGRGGAPAASGSVGGGGAGKNGGGGGDDEGGGKSGTGGDSVREVHPA